MGRPVNRLQLAETLAAYFELKLGLNPNPDEIVMHWTVPAMRKRIDELAAMQDKQPKA